MVEEVRRQFREHPGIMQYKEQPDYARCVEIVTAAAQKELLGPGIVAVATPAPPAMRIAAASQASLRMDVCDLAVRLHAPGLDAVEVEGGVVPVVRDEARALGLHGARVVELHDTALRGAVFGVQTAGQRCRPPTEFDFSHPRTLGRSERRPEQVVTPALAPAGMSRR